MPIGADRTGDAFQPREPGLEPGSLEVSLTGIIVAVLALALGAFGPRFRWRGAALMLAVMLGAGAVATVAAALDAQALGLRFVVTPWSVVTALAGQALFCFGLYGLSAATRHLLCVVAARRYHVSQ
jgi:hypothetical protein